MLLEELERLLDRHLEHVRDRLALEADVERLAVVALAVALLAGHVDVGQEVHLDLDLAVAAADLAAAALDVEREAARLVAARARLRRARVELADVVEHAGVGRRVRARRAPDRRLVDVDDLVDAVDARRPCGARRAAASRGAAGSPPSGRGPRSRASTCPSPTRRSRSRRRRAGTRRRSSSGCAARRPGPRSPRLRLRGARPAPAIWRLPRRNWPVSDSVIALDLLRRSLGDDPPAVLAGARPEVDDVVGRAHRPLVVLDDDHGVAEVAQPRQRVEQLAGCRAGAGRSRARRGCRARPTRLEPICVASRIRCASPPDSVAAARSSVR